MNTAIKLVIFTLFVGGFVLCATGCVKDPVYPPKNPYKIYRNPCATNPAGCNADKRNYEG